MVEAIKKMSQAFGAGALGGLMYAFLFKIFDDSGIMGSLGVERGFSPKHMMITIDEGIHMNALPWFYESISWCGLFGLLFLLPWMKGQQAQRGTVYGLVMAGFHLLYTTTMNGGGLFGINWGGFTFVFIALFSVAWGLVATSFVPNS